jgi:biotin carboxylase
LNQIQGAHVLCIGAGIEQLPVIRLARQMGLHVTAVDGDPEAIGLQAADRSRVMDLRNSDAVIQFAREMNTRCLLPVPLGAILTTVGAVNDALKFRGISEASARACTDKRATHHIFMDAGIPIPKFAIATTELDIAAVAVKTIGFPVILKPRSGSGSRGVFVARSISELHDWLPWHLDQRLKNNPSPSTIVEQFIPGQEIGVDGVVLDDRYAPLLIRDKEVTALPCRLPYAFLAPTHILEAQQQHVNAIVARAVAALGLRDCLVHADVILADDGKVYVVDISGRPSGFSISTRMIPAAIGVDPIRQTIQLSLGFAAGFQPLYQRGAVLRMLSAPQGYLHAVEGMEQVRQLPGVVAAETFLHPGDLIQERRTGAAYAVGYLLTTADTRDEANLLWQQAAQSIHFCVTEQAPQ